MTSVTTVSALREVEAAYREAAGLPPEHALTEADFKEVEACHAKWVKAGGKYRLPATGKEAPVRSVTAVTTSANPVKQCSAYIYKDRARKLAPRSMLPEVLEFLPAREAARAAEAAAAAAEAAAAAAAAAAASRSAAGSKRR
jgi:hypothetical protein